MGARLKNFGERPKDIDMPFSAKWHETLAWSLRSKLSEDGANEREQLMKREQILIIEENLDTAHQIVALCFKLGYEPLLVCDGFSGMLLAMRVKPRMIISDLETAGLDG